MTPSEMESPFNISSYFPLNEMSIYTRELTTIVQPLSTLAMMGDNLESSLVHPILRG
jgi:hypothetical protein